MTASQGHQDHRRNMALLVDGDNAQPSLTAEILAEAAKYGTIIVRRVYGDWTTPQMARWKKVLHAYAFRPQQQFPHASGKNATDSALIIDAMDLLHSRTINGFCIVSTDSDFTRLAIRIREEGLFVMGIGRPETPQSFVRACEVFVYTTNLISGQEDGQEPTADDRNAGGGEQGPKTGNDWTLTVEKAIESASRDDGWAHLGAVGHYVRDVEPAFDPRTFGHKKFSSLVASRPDLFTTRQSRAENGPAVIEVRLAATRTNAAPHRHG